MMRVLHTADWHLGRSLEGRSRLEEQEAFLDELVEMVQKEMIDIVLVAGDVYDSVNPPAAAEELFYDALSRLSDFGKRAVVVIAGNHDNPERLAASDPLAVRQRIHLIGYPTHELQAIDVARTGEKALIYALAYPSESRLKELMSASVDEADLRQAYSERIAQLLAMHTSPFSQHTVNIVMSHLFVLGGAETDSERPIQVGGAYTVDPHAFHVEAQYVALGHLHRPQTLKRVQSDAPLVRYSGSPLAYSFSEAGQSKSVTVLDMQPGRAPQLEELVLSSGRPLARWRAKQGLAQVYEWLDAGKDHQSWIDLEVHVNDALSMEDIQQLRKLHAGIVNIRPIFPEMAQEEAGVSAANLSIEELFRRFYMQQTGGGQPDDELVKLFLDIIQHE